MAESSADGPDGRDPTTTPPRRSPDTRAELPGRLTTDAGVRDFFGPQRTSNDALQDPRPLVHCLVRGLLEVLSGVREVEQLARWFSEDAYRALVTRAALAARARSARNVPAQRPTYGIQSVRMSSPVDGVLEVTVIVSAPARTRAIALRLEGIDRRWRVTTAALL